MHVNSTWSFKVWAIAVSRKQLLLKIKLTYSDSVFYFTVSLTLKDSMIYLLKCIIWIHGLQLLTVNGNLCTDLGRLWTGVSREDWLYPQNTEQAAPLFCYRELNWCSRSPQVLVPLQAGNSLQYILTSLCNPCLVVMLYNNLLLPEQWFPGALTVRVFAGEAFPSNKTLSPDKLLHQMNHEFVWACFFLLPLLLLKYSQEGQLIFMEPWPLARWYP